MPSKYRTRLTVGHTIDGKPIIKCISSNSKTEMKRKVDDLKYRLRTGEFFDNITFASWADRWYEIFKVKPNDLSDSSLYTYELCLKHLKEYFGGKALLKDITVVDIQNFFSEYTNYSESFCNKLKITIKSIFRMAQANGYILSNPCEAVKYPQGKKADEKRSYTKEEYIKVLEFAKTHKDGIGAYVILSTGMRRGELMGFVPSQDINYSKGIVYVRRTVTDDNGVVKIKYGGKTKNATRAIPVTKDFVETMKNINADKFLLPGKFREYRSPAIWARKDYTRFLNDLKDKYPNIPLLRPHELRHSFGTLLYKSGTDVYTIQKIMGHSSVDITTKIYVHDDEDDLLNNVKFI